MISIKLQSNFIEITLRHGYSPVNLMHIFKTPFPKITSGGLLLTVLLSMLNLMKNRLYYSLRRIDIHFKILTSFLVIVK